MAKFEELGSATETSTAGITQMTPDTEGTVIDGDSWDGLVYAVPWPSNSYIILEHRTKRAITLRNGQLYLQDIREDPGANNRWQCVEKQGYFGFCNLKSFVYIGHNGSENRAVATAKAHENWEQITPRQHPKGGYQLLFPYYQHTLRMLSVAEDGETLIRTNHGDARWDFVKTELPTNELRRA
ncbi:hypothetical protein B0I35DRAFT_422270 [Stachybotrys elegans]|uniref:Ricin B lectin domain-containing protein n=1 Tax=Stachybotrys elegans TaxID=80388 RepID=A0A8K0SW27_9HYPO|nr:hypothetical protein B0I35DRAFT_422270 [Stachybotrys elegans]